MFPRRIHQYRGAAICGCEPAWIASWREKNRNFEYQLWTETSAARFMEQQFGEAIGAGFADCRDGRRREAIFSTAVLLVLGGFYVGWDFECLQSIEPLSQLEGEALALSRHAGSQRTIQISDLEEKFLAARPGAQCMGRLLAELLNLPIVDKIERATIQSDILVPAGPGGDPCVNRLTPDAVDCFVKSHWHCNEDSSRERNHKSLARYGEATPVRWVPFLFLGHPRCGSSSLSSALLAAGLRVRHERLGEDGAVTWWHTGRRVPKATWPTFAHGSEGKKEFWLGGRIFHYMRDPRDAVPSIVLENEVRNRTGASFEVRRRKLLKEYGVDIFCLDAPTAAATSYALWNKLAEDLAADGMIRIERPVLPRILPMLGTVPVRRSNLSEQKFGMSKPVLDLTDAIRRSPMVVRPIMERYLSLYANTPEMAGVEV